jgi:[ribosomal protein S5]-alanine N-acetyltransferase
MTLETSRCFLTRLTPDDQPSFLRLKTTPEIRRYLGGVLSTEEALSRFEEALKCDNFVVRDRASGQFMGLITLDSHHGGPDTEISYEFLPEFQGKGYATEALIACIGHAFESLGLTRLVAETQAANLSSRRLLERAGMIPERTLRRFGEEQIVYSITADADVS